MQRSASSTPRDRTSPAADADFDRFWLEWPNKVAKADARKAWQQTSAIRPGIDQLITAIAEQVLAHDWCEARRRFIPYPATWLRGERWADEVAIPIASPAAQQKQRTVADGAAQRAAAMEAASRAMADAAMAKLRRERIAREGACIGLVKDGAPVQVGLALDAVAVPLFKRRA